MQTALDGKDGLFMGYNQETTTNCHVRNTNTQCVRKEGAVDSAPRVQSILHLGVVCETQILGDALMRTRMMRMMI